MRLITLAALVLLSAPGEAAEFREITATDIAGWPPLWKPVVTVAAISGDGSTIGGSLTLTGLAFDCAIFDCATSAFVWNHADSTRRSLGDLALNPSTNAPPKSVTALSFDGSTALVTHEYRHYESGLHRNNVVSPLRNSITPGQWLVATDMVPDASVVVGSLGETPFRWSEANGLEGFEGIADDSGYGPTAISADGSTTIFNDFVAGPNLISVGEERRNAIRWTDTQGPVELPPLDDSLYSNANALSADGSMVVGTSFSEQVSAVVGRATMWIGATPSPLAPVFETGSSYALDVSADGSSIVGWAIPVSPLTDAYLIAEAILWRDGIAHVLEELLAEEYGLGDAIAGWSLTSATAISADGTAIAGQGIAPDGSAAAWVAVLAVPEPSGGVLTAIAVLAVLNTTVRQKYRGNC